jgi:uncharacterized membrane protein
MRYIYTLKNALIALITVLSFSSAFAQTKVADKKAPSVLPEKCGFDAIHRDRMKSDAKYRAGVAEMEQHYQAYLKNPIKSKAVITIPVVVHVMHVGEAEGVGSNITDAQIQSAIDNLNDAFAANPGYTNSVNTEIQFCMAQRDENNNPHSGINRVNATGTANYENDGITSANDATIKNLSKWDRTKYYNFWIVYKINGSNGAGTQGYAYLPPGGSEDGAVILYNSFGYDPGAANGYELKSYTQLNTTTTHEIGHAMNLQHTFEGDGGGGFCPVDGNCTTDGDFVCDTPPHARSTSNCNTSGTNSCDNGSSNSLFVNNFMDYSSSACQVLFTPGQSTRMNAIFVSGGSRYSLTQSEGCNPLTALDAGITSVIAPAGSYCKTTFSPVVTLKNFGSSTLTSVAIKYNIDGGAEQTFNWTGSIANGISQNVTITPAVTTTSGPHTFTASTDKPNGGVDEFQSNDSKAENFTIDAATLPFTEGFEGETFPPAGWQTYQDPAANAVWGRTTAAHNNGASTGIAYMRTSSNSRLRGDKDNLVSPAISLSGATNPTLEFKIAYRTFISSQRTDKLRVFVSKDCGVSWDPAVYFKDGPALATAGAANNTSSDYHPASQSEYRTETIDLNAYYDESIQLRWEWTDSISQNFFLDDINLYNPCITPATPGNISGTDVVCEGDTVEYSVERIAGADSYNWTVPTGSIIKTGQGTQTISVIFGATGGDVSLNASSACGTSGDKSKPITLTALPVAPASISGDLVVCENATGVTYSISEVTNASNYTWSTTGGITLDSGQGTVSITVDYATTGGDISVYASSACGDGQATTISTTTRTKPVTPGQITGEDTVCVNSAGNVYSVASVAQADDYIWSLPAGASITAGDNTDTITVTFGNTAGAIEVAADNTCGTSSPSSMNVFIIDTPAQADTIKGPNEACKNATGIIYNIDPILDAASYNWTVPSGATITAGQGTVSITVNFGASGGSVSVSVANKCGTSAILSKDITLENPPGDAGLMSGPTSGCQGNTGQTYSTSAVADATTYTWTVPTGSTITSGQGTISIEVTFGGTSGEVTVTPSNSCGDGASSTYAVTLSAVPGPGPITGLTEVCANDQGIVYSIAAVTGATAYTWTVPTGSTIATGQNTISITVDFGSVSDDISVTSSNSCGTGTASDLAVNVTSKPAMASPITGEDSLCSNTTDEVYSIPADANADTYSWTIDNGASITAGQNTESVTINFGTLSETLKVSATNQCGNSDTLSFFIQNISTPAVPDTIYGDDNMCEDQTGVVYSIDAVDQATSYTWSVPADATIVSGQGTLSVTVDYAASSGEIKVTASNNCGTSADYIKSVAVRNIPTNPGAISGTTNDCQYTNGVTYSVATDANVEDFIWTVPTGSVIVTGDSTATITVDLDNVDGDVTVYGKNLCGQSSPSTLTLTMTPAPDKPVAILGEDTVCVNTAGQTYSIAADADAVDYTWTVPAGMTITSGQGTDSITVDFTNVDGTIEVVTNSASCPSKAQTLDVYILTLPSQGTSITGSTTICENSAGNGFTVVGIDFATSYTWSVPAGSTINFGQGTDSISMTAGPTSEDITVFGKNKCGDGPDLSQAITITNVTNTPVAILGDDLVCENETGVSYSINDVPGANTFTWTVPAGATLVSGQGTTSIVVDFTTTTVTLEVTAGGVCTTSEPQTLTVNTHNVPVFTGPITGDQDTCVNSMGIAYSISTQADTDTYTWTVPTGADVATGQGTDAIAVDFGVNSGDIQLFGINECGNGDTLFLQVGLNNLPTQADSIYGRDSVCPNTQGFTYFVNTIDNTTNYQWTVSGGASIKSGQGTSSITVDFGSTPGNISVTPSNECGDGLTKNLPYRTIIGEVAGAITGKNLICENKTGEPYSTVTVANATNYQWTVPTGSNVVSGQGTENIVIDFGTTAGNITVNVTGICRVTSTQYPFTLKAVPAQPGPIQGQNLFCENTGAKNYSISSVANATSYFWTIPSGATILAGQGTANVSVNFKGNSGNIAVYAANDCGRSNERVKDIFISNVPAAPDPIEGPSTVCELSNGNIFTTAQKDGIDFYSWSVPSDAVINLGQGSRSINVKFGSTSGRVFVTANNVCGVSQPTFFSVTVDELPDAPTSIIGEDRLCIGAEYIMSVAAVSNATSYNWTVPLGTTIVGGQGTDSLRIIAGTNDGNITINAANDCGNRAAVSMSVVMKVSPQISRGNATNPSSCTTENGSINVIINQAGWLYWNKNQLDSAMVTGTNHTIPNLGGGTYDVYLVSNAGCASNYLTVTLFATGQGAKPTIYKSHDNDLCYGETITLTVTPGNSYLWNTNETEQEIYVTENSKYAVAVEDINGCIGISDTMVVNFIPLPQVSLNELDEVCKNWAEFEMVSGTPAEGTYSGLGITTNKFNPYIYPMNSTVYIYYTVEENGCENTATDSIFVSGCASLTEEELASYTVYPNPSNGQMTIEASANIQTWTLLDVSGRILATGNSVNESTLELDFSDRAKGVYMLSVRIDGKEDVSRIFIK